MIARLSGRSFGTVLVRTALVLGLTLAVPGALGASEAFTFEVEEGMIVEGCGGLVGDCREHGLTGSLVVALDAEAGTAAIVDADLRLGGGGSSFPLTLDMPFTELGGTFDGETVRFSTPEGFHQEVDWRLALTAEGARWNGVLDEGCCDRFVYTFRNVVLRRLGDTRLLLGGGRFAVEVYWSDYQGNEGPARAISLGPRSGYLWFFREDNPEILVKILDGCRAYGRYWFFAAGLTNLKIEITATDLVTGLERTYRSPLGRNFQPILDVEAFPDCDA